MDKMYLQATCLTLALLFSAPLSFADGLQVDIVRSPSGKLQAAFHLEDGVPLFAISWKGRELVDTYAPGFTIAEVPPGKWAVKARRNREVDESWKPVWGKRSTITDHHRELVLSLESESTPSRTMEITCRVHDDGVAFRYALFGEEDLPLELTRDGTRFGFTVDATAWSYRPENRPRGPEQLSAIEGRRLAPMTLEVAEDCYVALLEAALSDFGWLELASDAGSRSLTVEMSPTKRKTPFVSPWRVLLVGESPGSLVDSDLLETLNPECAIEDTSWIEPGVAFWDWRAWGHQAGEFTYGLDLPSWKRFVDLASETGVPYLLLDANWYGPEFDASSDPVKGDKARDVREIIGYGQEKGVGLLLYLNDAATRSFELETILRTYHEWGAAGLKYGFMHGSGQAKVNKTRRIIELCAKYRLLCDFHDGPVPPSGEIRTWPNCVTREFCHSQSDAKRVFTPETYCLQVYVNMLAGPLDMCNGLFEMTDSLEDRPKIFAQLDSTITAEAARTLITYSGLTVLPDSADVYRAHPELFGFIAAEKQPWAESRTLAGVIGDYIVMARRTGDTWLVGASTDENARALKIPLDFLGEGRFEATIFADTPTTHWRTNREAYRIEHRVVQASDTIEAWLAPGGGCCMLVARQ
jgi:alpha-glucosidase